MKKTVLLAYLLACGGLAFGQAPTVDKSALAFTYQYNNATFPSPAKVTAKLTSTTTAMTVTVAYSSVQQGWVYVTPTGGTSPLVLSVTANPTSFAPGTYNATIDISTGGANCTLGTNCTAVAVSLMVTNPASSLQLGPGGTGPQLTATTTATAFTLALPFTSGGPLPTAEIDVSTTGDIIPFTVTTAVTKAGTGSVANWLRVNSGSPTPMTSTSGVASSSSIVPVYVTLDQSTLDTLDAINYTGTITIAPVKTGSSSSASTTSYTVTVTLSVAPGTPIFCLTPSATPTDPCYGVPVPVFPPKLQAFPASSTVTPVPPVLTLYGNNFFSNGSWVFYQRTSVPSDQSFHPLPTTWVSRRILTAVIPVADLTPTTVNPPVVPPETWTIFVVNGAPNTLPSNGSATTSPGAPFKVLDPGQPYIQSIVNAASYLSASTQLPVGSTPPYPPGTSVVSPREIVSIFGQSLGPNTICSNVPTALSDTNGNPIMYNGNPVMGYSQTLTCGDTAIAVAFQVGTNKSWQAPLIMATYNQINAIVPWEIAFNDDLTTPVADNTAVSIIVTVGPNPTDPFGAVKMTFDPGIFTFGGNGQGQAAVLNVDATTGAVTVNGNVSAPKGSPIEIYMTGLGDLVQYGTSNIMADGQVANSATTGPVSLFDNSYRVLIGGQSAPIFYAGTAGTGVAGLVQINAIVPPNTASGPQSITVEIGGPNDTTSQTLAVRRSQTGVTINVK